MDEENAVEIPEFFEFFRPILNAMEELGGRATNEKLEESVTGAMHLNEEQKAVIHDPDRGNQTEVGYRMAWARSYLKKVGYLENPERGVWSLTTEGRNADIENPLEIVYEVRGADSDEKALDTVELETLASKALEEPEPPVRSVRELLELFGHRRRGKNVVRRIRGALRDHGLRTWPPFDSAHIDAKVEILPIEEPENEEGAETSRDAEAEYEDPVPRIAQLAAANRAPTSVNRDDPLERATTLMLQNDFSQLPVLQGERSVDGYISWETIGQSRVTGNDPDFVREAMATPARVLRVDVPLIEAVAEIRKHEFIFVQGPARKIRGPVTTADITVQFRQLAEPFLRIGEIEGQLRRLLVRLSPRLLEDAKAPGDPERDVDGVEDLTFGEYVRLMENPDTWEELDLTVDRQAVVRRLNRVREIRNHVMHFQPDPLDGDDERLLTLTSSFLEKLLQ